MEMDIHIEKDLRMTKPVDWSMLLQQGYTMRSARKEDLEAVVELLNAATTSLVGAGKFSTSELALDWEMPGLELGNDTQVVLNPDGKLVGYEDVFDLDAPHVRIYCFGQVHPDHTGKGLGSALLAWAEERARCSISKAPDDARVALVANTLTVNQKAVPLYRDAGFQLVRYSLRMVIELDESIPDPEWPIGIVVHPFMLGEDDEITVQAVRDSFSDHWGFVQHPFESELERYRHFWKTDEDFDPALVFLAMDGGQVAGISLCHKKVQEDPEMGWVGTLGVLRPWRRKGLGLALLRHSFREFQRKGKKRIGLGVDAESLTGATRLYEKAGMQPDPAWQWSLYEKELRPGIELSTQTVTAFTK